MFTLAVTQAPHASYFNGGTDPASRQYFLRPTQHEPHGPRIDAAISGIAPGEFRPVWVNNTGDIFSVRLPTTNGKYNTLDWTPRAVWDSATQQLIVGGRRGHTKLIAYSDITGDWRVLPMPTDLGRIIQGTVHYYGLIEWGGAGRVFVGNTDFKSWALDAEDEDYVRLADHVLTNGGNGAMFAWSPHMHGGHGGLVKYAGDAQRWLVYNPVLDAWSLLASSLGHGQHALLEYHEATGTFLLVGGTNTSTRASIVTAAGAVTRVSDIPQPVAMSAGSWIVAHPSGCWLVRAHPTTGTKNLFAYWPDTDTWDDLGVAPDAALTYPTAAVDYERGIILIIATSGLYAYAFPTL